jgi:hypothetical protein
MIKKIQMDGVPEEVLIWPNPDYEIMKSTINHSDAVIIASEGVSSSLTKFINLQENLFTFVLKMLSLGRITFTMKCFKINYPF